MHLFVTDCYASKISFQVRLAFLFCVLCLFMNKRINLGNNLRTVTSVNKYSVKITNTPYLERKLILTYYLYNLLNFFDIPILALL